MIAGISVRLPLLLLLAALISPFAEGKVTYYGANGIRNNIYFNDTSSCSSCHYAAASGSFNSGGYLDLSNYSKFVTYQISIRDQIDSGSMPYLTTDLPENEQTLIKQWVIDGALDGDTPDLTLDSANVLSKSSAILNATIDPNGGTPSQYIFEYHDENDGSFPEQVISTSLEASSIGSGGGGDVSGFDSESSIDTTLEDLACGTTYYWRVQATNSYGTDYSSTGNFTTSSCNFGPTITTTDLGNATEETLFQIQVQATDSEGDDISFALTQAPIGMTIDSELGTINWTPTEAQSGFSFDVTVTATDSSADVDATDSETFSIQAIEVNDPPSITSTANDTATEDVLYNYQVTVEDDDDTSFVFSLLAAPAGMLVDENTGLISWTPVHGQTSGGTVIVQVSDDDATNPLTDTQNFDITVTEVNDAPVISSSAITEVNEDQSYSYDVNASDEEGEQLSYSLSVSPVGMTIDSSSGVIAWLPTVSDIGENDVTVVVSDGNSQAEQPYVLTVLNVNDAPVIDSTAILSASEAVLYEYQVTATDEEDDVLAFSLTSSPSGMSVDSVTGLISWTPDNVIEGYETNITVAVSDGAAEDSQTFTIVVTANNDAPAIISSVITSAEESQLYTYDVDATDLDSSNLEYSLLTAPAGMEIDSATGEINWTPAEALTEYSENVTVQVADEESQITQSYSITVSADNDAPEITSSPSTELDETDSFSYQVTAVDLESETLTFSLDSSPEGMTIDASTGQIDWDVDDSESSYDVEVIVSVADSIQSMTQTFTLLITADNDSPVITSVAPTAAQESELYTYTVEGSDTDTETLSFSLTVFPSGMIIDTISGEINWTPNESSADYTEDVQVQISDGNTTSVQDFVITVSANNDGPEFTSSPVEVAVESESYSYELTASDPENDDLTFSISSGPKGLAIDGNLLTWVPDEAVENYQEEVIVSVTDGQQSRTQQFTVNVSADNDGPSFSNLSTQSATENTQLAFDVDATDPENESLTFSLNTSIEGLTIDASSGVVSWTPFEAIADYQQIISISVTDGENTNSDSFTVNVSADDDPPVFNSSPVTNAQEAVSYSYLVSASDGEGTQLSYSLLTAPDGMTIDSSTGAVSWLPPDADSNYTASVLIEASDGNQARTQDFVINVVADADTPIITSSALTSAIESEVYQYDVDATDNQNDTLTFTLTNSPDGMSIDSVSGLIDWLPPENTDDYSASVEVTVSDGSFSSSQSFSILVSADNDSPIFISEAIEAALEGEAYSYTAIATDAEGDALSYSLSSGPEGMSVNDVNGLVTWTVPLAPANFVQPVSILVTDGTSISSQNFSINVTTSNDAPLITSTAVLSATENLAYEYQISVNDPDDENNGSDLAFTLLQAPEGMAVSALGLIEWTPSDDQTGESPVQVQVSDGGEDGALPDSQSFTILVEAVNDAPVISSVPSTSAVRFREYVYQVLVDDPDDDLTELIWQLSTDVDSVVLSETGLLTWTPQLDDEVANVTITVADGGEDGAISAQQTFSIVVSSFNFPPEITSEPLLAATEDQLYSYQIEVSDLDDSNNGVDLTFTLKTAPTGMTVSTTGLINWMPTDVSESAETVIVTVADGGEDGSEPALQEFEIVVTHVNDAPVITSTPLENALEGNEWQYQLTIVDPDDDFGELEIAVNSQLGDELTVTETGLLSWLPKEGQLSSGEIVIQVSDGGEDNAEPATQSFTVLVTSVNQGPSVDAVTLLTATEDELYQYSLVVNDPDDANDGEAITYQIISAPVGFAINEFGVMSWTPTNEQLQPQDVEIQISDGGEDGVQPVDLSFVLTVVEVNDPPTFSSMPILTAVEGETYLYNLEFEDEETAPDVLILELVSSPQSMVLEGRTIEWTPENGIERADVSVQVSDGEHLILQNFTITVTPVNDAPVFESSALTQAIEDELYQYQIEISDIDSSDLTLSLLSGPTGMELTGNLLEWTPTEGITSASVSLSLTDNELTVFQVFNIVVDPVNDSPQIAPIAPVQIVELQSVNQAVFVTDVDSLTVELSLVSAPEGMVLGDDGVIRWTAPEFSAGNYVVQIEADDGALLNGIAVLDFNLTVLLLDQDDDSFADYNDNCPITSNVSQSDLDSDGLGDECDTDMDGDLITDTVELLVGLNPNDPSDALLDLDGDGLSNLAEFQICQAQQDSDCSDLNRDNVPPEIILSSAHSTVESRSTYTQVALVAKAFDQRDGEVDVTLLTPGPYQTGRHIIEWQAQDNSGNVATVNQVLDVLPLVSLSGVEIVAEPQSVDLVIRLNGEAPAYPVVINFEVSGSADEEDSDLRDGSVVIKEGKQANVSFNVLDDDLNESDEEIVITLTGIEGFAALHPEQEKLQIRYVIAEGNLAPQLNITVSQQGQPVSTIYQDAGTVEVVIDAYDPNNDVLDVNTDFTDGLNVEEKGVNVFEFEPSSLILSAVDISASADDGQALIALTKSFEIVPVMPVLSSTLDSDGDGISDQDEGLADSDQDRVPDYLDAHDDPSVIALNPKQDQVMETDGGLTLSLGNLAAKTQSGGTALALEDVTDNSGNTVNDEAFTLVGDVFDFEVSGLNQVQTTARIVIPLSQAIPLNAVYRKFDGSQWVDFVIDGENELASSVLQDGVCPRPESGLYRVGLNAFDTCVRLTLSDGGPNDADGLANGVIVDPGGIAIETQELTVNFDTPKLEKPTKPPEGASSINLLLFLGITVLIGFKRQVLARVSKGVKR